MEARSDHAIEMPEPFDHVGDALRDVDDGAGDDQHHHAREHADEGERIQCGEFYSDRNATTGSTRAARQAGRYAAMTAMAVSTAAAIAIVAGSEGCNPN